MAEQNSIELEIKEALEIDEADILAELRRHSAKYFYYGVLWARASKQKRRIRLKTRELESRLTNALRTSTDARITAEMKAEYLNSHPEFLEAEQELIQAEYMEEVLDVARDAMKQRGIALSELARQNRAEEMYGNEFSAMKREYKEQVEEIPKKRNRKTKAELMAAKQQEVTEYEGNSEVV
jgi:hypothetical protein